MAKALPKAYDEVAPCKASGNPRTARVVVVGEAPLADELIARTPFVGAHGRIFWGTAADVGLDRSSCFVTHVVQSVPLGAHGVPTRSQVREEWDRLDAEMASCVAAEILILAGPTALRRLAGWPSIVDLNAYILLPEDVRLVEIRRRVQVGEYKTSRAPREDEHGNITPGYKKGDPKFAMKCMLDKPVLPPNLKYIVSCYNPETVRSTGFKLKPALTAALQRVGYLLKEKYPQFVTPTSGTASHSPRFIALDIETPMPPNDWVVERLGVCTGGRCVTSLWDGETARNTLDYFTSSAYLAFHNASYDIPRLEKAIGARFNGFLWDTMYGAQLLNPDLPKGLERAAPILLPVRPWKHLFETDPDYYNKMDAAVTYELAVAQHEIFTKTGQLEVFLNMMKGLPVLMRMHSRGIRIDEHRREEWEETLAKKVEELTRTWPRPDVDPHSHYQVKKLFAELGLPTQYNKDGGVTVDAGAIYALIQYGKEVPLLQHLLALRRASKELSTYAEVSTHGGFVYPEYSPVDKDTEAEGGAGTGRITARNPSITNQSAEARTLYIPSHPSRRLGYADWSQAELRYDAARSKDRALAKALDDPGGVPATVMLAVPSITDRVRAKNLIYGKRNLAGARTITKEIHRHGQNVKEAEIQAQLDELAKLFPDWTAHSLFLAAEGRAKGYITNAFGRRRYFYDRKRAAAMVGFDAQSAVADMMWEILPELDEVTTLLCTIYDGVLFEFEDESEARGVKEVMQQEFYEVAPGFRLPVELKLGLPGESWGDMERRLKS